MKNWYKIIAMTAVAMISALTLASCGDDSSSTSSLPDDAGNNSAADDFTLTRDYAIRFDTLDGKPYFIRYTPSCYYRDEKFVLDVDSTLYLYLFDIKKDSLYFRNLEKKGEKFVKSDYGSLFFGDHKSIFGTWEDKECFVDYTSGEIECDEEYFEKNIKISKDSLVFSQTFPEGVFTDIKESEEMNDILYSLLNLSGKDAEEFYDDPEKVYKNKKVEVLDRDTYTTHISINGKEISADFSGSKFKGDISEINVTVSFGKKVCKGHFETSLTPWKYCSEEFKDKLFIFEDMVDYSNNNNKEFYPCLNDLLK